MEKEKNNSNNSEDSEISNHYGEENTPDQAEGRKAWFDHSGTRIKPLVIGVTGGSASGKTSVCRAILQTLKLNWALTIGIESFYKTLNKENIANVKEYNFDHPNAFDFEKMIQTIEDVRMGKAVQIPVYDFKMHKRFYPKEVVYGVDVILVEGILVLYSPALRDLIDIKIFVDLDEDLMLSRRLLRDCAERGRTSESVLYQYFKFVKPAFERYILPTKQFADLVVPRGASNQVAINLVSQHILNVLRNRGTSQGPGNQLFSLSGDADNPKSKSIPNMVHKLTKTMEMDGILSILRNRKTSTNDFVFFLDRISSLLIEASLNFLPYKDKKVITDNGNIYEGCELATNVLAISILRGGSTMERSLRQVLNDVIIGKILLQSKGKQPVLFYVNIPIRKDHHVLLLDPLLGSGNSLTMAMRILQDHGYCEEKIIFVTILASLPGLQSIHQKFPNLRIVCADIDMKLDAKGYIIPGMGNISDRYFDTGIVSSDSEINLN